MTFIRISLLCKVNLVLIAAPISQTLKEKLLSESFQFIDTEKLQEQAELKEFVKGIITSNKLVLDQTALSTFPQLEWVARIGSGMEIIDTKYCDAHGIRYYNSPGGIANAVAEHAMGMLLGLLHRIPDSFAEIQDGLWMRESNRGQELQGKKIGIIGFGHTGQALVQKLQGFDVDILVYDKYFQIPPSSHYQVCDLSTLQKEADIVSFHVPLIEETRHYYNASFRDGMKKKHILINTSRGAVADTQAILAGLKSGKILGACLDVLEEEKNIIHHLNSAESVLEKLMTYPVVLTPHIAGYSHEAIEKMSLEIIRQLFSVSVPIAQTFVQAKKFELSLIVDQEHLDHNDHVNNLEYIKWAHWISGKHWEAEAETIYREKLKWVVVKNEIEYLKPLFHGDEVRLETWIEKIEKAKCWRRVNIYRKSDQQLVATALIVWYALDAVSGRPSRIPQELADHFLNIPPTYSNL